MLMERCPNCGGHHTIRRNVQEFGTRQEWSFVYCIKPGCYYSVEKP